jgi:hypothetical protein
MVQKGLFDEARSARLLISGPLRLTVKMEVSYRRRGVWEEAGVSNRGAATLHLYRSQYDHPHMLAPSHVLPSKL